MTRGLLLLLLLLLFYLTKCNFCYLTSVIILASDKNKQVIRQQITPVLEHRTILHSSATVCSRHQAVSVLKDIYIVNVQFANNKW